MKLLPPQGREIELARRENVRVVQIDDRYCIEAAYYNVNRLGGKEIVGWVPLHRTHHYQSSMDYFDYITQGDSKPRIIHASEH